MSNQIVLLTKAQKEQLVKESLGILKSAAWKKYHIKPQDMDDFIQECLLYFYNYKDKKYFYGGYNVDEIDLEKARYRRFFLYSTKQNFGDIYKTYKENYISDSYFTQENEDTLMSSGTYSQILMKKFISKYEYVEDLRDADKFFEALVANLKGVFKWDVARKVKYYIKQHRKGKKVSWERYFHDEYAPMKSTVKRKFRKLCQETATSLAMAA